MANEEQLVNYPRGQFALSPGGRMKQVTTVSARVSMNARLKHTLNSSPSGYNFGLRECSGSFNIEVPVGGEERDVFNQLAAGKTLNATIEIPASRVGFIIVLNEISLEVPLDDAVRLTISFIGKFTGKVAA